MINSESLSIGRVYFQATYKDPGQSMPIVLSFQYLGKDIHGTPTLANSSKYYFQFLPGFEPGDASSPMPIDAPFSFEKEDLSSLHDLAGLLEELQARIPAWSKSGQ